MIKIKGQTLFDITATGVTGHFKSARVPFVDKGGNRIVDADTWNRARNQQRNWETLTQLISLRTQITEVVEPTHTNGVWTFYFASDQLGVFGDESDPVSVLKSDADGVPMLRNLDNRPDIEPTLKVSGPTQNLWFTQVSINN